MRAADNLSDLHANGLWCTGEGAGKPCRQKIEGNPLATFATAVHS